MAKKPRKLNNGGGIGRVSALMSSAAPSAKHDLFIIDDETINDPRIKDMIFCPVIEGQIKGHGMKPRQHSVYPPEMFAAPSAIPIIPASEREARAKELAERGGTLKQMLQAAGIPSMDQDGQGYCLVPGTPVLMGDRTTKPVQEVKAGDLVFTHTGKRRKVIRPTSRPYTGRLHSVFGPGRAEFYNVVCTDNHPFLTDDGRWVEARRLDFGDRILFRGEAVQAKTFLATPVKDQPVFCLEVEEDHSFIANGYAVHNCWGHSSTGAEQTARCKAGLPYVPLSAFSVCSTIKRGRDEGGWCGLSAQFLRTKGVMPQSVWPQGDYRNPSKYDTPENWARAARFKTTGEYVDLTRDVYDQNLTLDMIDSLGLMGMPMAWDFNWWGHSVMGLDAVFPEAGSVARQGRNSWGDSWQNGGWFVLRGSKAVPDSALCIYMAVAS